jgi:hypothetical protein
MENEYFAEVKTIKHGYNAKRIGYKWGLYDDEGMVLMRPLYDYISIDQEGRIWARYKGKKFFVKENNLPYPFDFIHDSEIKKEWYVIESNGYLGVADSQLNVIIPIQYKYIIDYGGILWCSNEHVSSDTRKGVASSYLNCTLFSYKAERISNSTFKLYDLSLLYTPPVFPIVYNEDGYNLLDNNNKLVLSTPAKKILKIKDWYIIVCQTENKLYNYKKNRFVDSYKYTDIKLWKRDSSVFICKRSSENICDVYINEKLVASYNPFDYSLFDVVDDFIIVWKRWYSLSSENMLPKYGFINNKGLAVPCIYDRIIVHNGAVGIVDAEVFEETSSEYKENAIYIDYNSSRIQNFYVTKGRFDVFGFDGRCICEDNDIIKSSLLWDFKSDIYFIKRKYIEWESSGKERIRVDQYDSSGRVKCIYGVKEANWDVYNHKFNIKFEDGSSVSHPASASHTFSFENEKTENIKEPQKTVYSATRIAEELLSSDYCSCMNNIVNSPKSNTPKNNVQTDCNLEFCEGLSPVIKDGKWGYINENGGTIIPFVYNGAKPFSDGLAAVKKGKYYGYIDYNNKVIIDFQFVEAGPFNEGLAKFDNNPNNWSRDPVDHGYVSKDGCFIDRTIKYTKIDTCNIDYERETWDAMTDGMYGDYSGSGVIGFGI